MSVVAVAVEGVGAVEVPVPPVAELYHKRLEPLAVKAVAVAPTQYVTGLLTVGAAVPDDTLTVMLARELSHPDAEVWLT